MALKAAIVQQAARTTTGDQSFTDSNAGFASDVKAAIFFSSIATAVDTNTTGQIFTVGAMCSNSTQIALSLCQNGTNRNARTETAYPYCVSAPAGGSTCEFSQHATTPFLSNGVQVTYVDAADQAHLISCLLLGGDIEAKIITVDLAAVSSVTGVAHGLGGTPELIIALSNFDINGLTAANDVTYSLGFWDGTNYVSDCRVPTGGYTIAGQISTSALVGKSDGGGLLSFGGYLTLANVGSSTLDVVASKAVDFAVALLCIRGTTDPIVAKCGTFDSPTSTGSQAVGASLSVAPQVLLTLGSRFTAVNSGSDTAVAGQCGAFAACNNVGAGTQYGGSVSNTDDSATLTSWTTNSKAFVATATDGSSDAEASVSAWGSGDVTLNFDSVAASALKVPYLAFGVGAAGGNIPKILRSSGGMIDLSGNFRG